VRGNRRSDNIPEGAGSAAEDTTVRIAPAEPQISKQGLQFAGFTPIQPLPSIKDVTDLTRTLSQQVMNAQAPTATQDPASPQPEPAGTETQNASSPQPEQIETETQNIVNQQPAPADTENTDYTHTTANDDSTETPSAEAPAETETFADCWTQMVDAIFQKKPAFYHQLHDYLPRYEEDIIYVDVENDFQKNQLEMSKRAMLEFWRNHFQLNVNDIEFIIQEHERKKVIYTSEDKVANMLEQNPKLKEFLQVLNFRIKD